MDALSTNFQERHSPQFSNYGYNMESPWNYLSSSHATHVIDAINELRKNKELCDVILVVNEHCIPAHRLILSACSPYFHGLFDDHDHNSLHLVNHPIEVPLSGIDPYAAESAIDYCYTSRLLIDDENVWSILPAACLLQLEEVQNVCSDFLRGRLSLSNCVRMRLVAAACHCEELISLSEEYIELKFEELISSEEGLGHLTEENLSAFLSQLLTKQLINEDRVNDAVKHWLDHGNVAENRVKKLHLIAKKLPCVNKKFKLDVMTDKKTEMATTLDHSKMEECPICCLLLPSKFHLHDHFRQQHSDTAMASDFDQSPHGAVQPNVKCSNEKRCSPGSADLICEICSQHYKSDIDMTNHCLGHMEGFSPVPQQPPYMPLATQNATNVEMNKPPQPAPVSPPMVNLFVSATSSAFLNTIKGEKKYRCKLCGVETATEKEMYVHCRSHRISDTPLLCPVTICTKNFENETKWLKHLVHHSTVVYFRCPYCEKQSRTKANLQIHLRIHTGERPFVCTYCSKGFRNYCVLKVHIRSHTGEKPFKCELCTQCFTKNIHLKRHISTHSHAKPFACDICGKGFGRNDHLQRHIKTIHTQEKPHHCVICGKDFVRRYELDRHMRHHLKQGKGQASSFDDQAVYSDSALVPATSTELTTFDQSASTSGTLSIAPTPRVVDSGMSTLDPCTSVDSYRSSPVVSSAERKPIYSITPALRQSRKSNSQTDRRFTGPLTSTPRIELFPKTFDPNSEGVVASENSNPNLQDRIGDGCFAPNLIADGSSVIQVPGLRDTGDVAIEKEELFIKQNGSVCYDAGVPSVMNSAIGSPGAFVISNKSGVLPFPCT